MLFICFSNALYAQILETDKEHFTIEFDSWKPATKDMIRSFEGTKAMPFLAPDTDGQEQFLGNYVGKNVFIYFFNTACKTCQLQINALNLMQNENGNHLQIIGIGDETKEKLQDYKKENDIQFPILYNGKLLGEAAYGIELGYPRLFALDENGIIREVVPEEGFPETERTYLLLKNLLELIKSQ
jgi:peroxiredoxin